MPRFTCFECSAHFSTVSILSSHLRIEHQLRGNNTKLVCGQDNCRRPFDNYKFFYRHIKRHHSEGSIAIESNALSFNRDSDTNENSVIGELNIDGEENVHSPRNSPVPQIENIPAPISSEFYSYHTLKILAAMKQKPGVPQNLVDTVTSNVHELLEKHTLFMAQNISLACNHLDLASDTFDTTFSEASNELNAAIGDLSTEYKQMKFLKERYGLVLPKTRNYGISLAPRYCSKSGRFVQTSVNDSFQYISLIDQIKLRCQNPEFVTHLENDHESQDGVLRDYCDGKHCRQHPLYKIDKNFLKLGIYSDEFEIANPLGSKSQKVTAFYCVIKNLPPTMNSTLSNIFVVGLANYKFVKTYGYGKLLEPLIQECQILAFQGITLPNGSVKYGSVVTVSADNLAANSLFGFVESFNAHYYCRLCLTSKEDAQKIFNSCEVSPRTLINYESHIKTLKDDKLDHYKGIKRRSDLNKFPFFHILKNFSLDIMHDVLEGVLALEIRLLLLYLINDINIMSLDEFNSRLVNFSYGFADRKNKPSPITNLMSFKGSNIGQRASQCYCLARTLPFLVADKLEEHNPELFEEGPWLVFSLLLRIMDIIFAPEIPQCYIPQLRMLIQMHHETFIEVYPDVGLKPKHHFMLHYPECLEQVGPLVNVWCMRFESKHSVLKQFGTGARNFKNIALTLAKKIQVQQILNQLDDDVVQCGPGDTIPVFHLEGYSSVISAVPNLNFYSDVYVVNHITIHGSCFKPGLMIYCGYNNELPQFQEIVSIIKLSNGQYGTILKPWDTLYFDDRYHAFGITASDQSFSFRMHDQFLHQRPMDKLSCFDKELDCLFVAPRYILL